MIFPLLCIIIITMMITSTYIMITMITWVMFLSSSPCKLLLVSPPSSAPLALWQSGIEVNAPITLCNQMIIIRIVRTEVDR